MLRRPWLVLAAAALAFAACSSEPPDNRLPQDYTAIFVGTWVGIGDVTETIDGQSGSASGLTEQKVTAIGYNQLQLPGFCTGQDVGPTAQVISSTAFKVDAYSCSYPSNGCTVDLTITGGSGTLYDDALYFVFGGSLHQRVSSGCSDVLASYALSIHGHRAGVLVAPTNLVATQGYSYNNVQLTWTPVSGATGYAIQYRIGSDAYQNATPGNLYNGSASVDVYGVPELSTVTFRIYAFSGSTAHSDASNEAPYQFPLFPVANFWASPVSEGVQLSWSLSSSVATALTLERSLVDTAGNPGTWSTLPDVPFPSTGFLDTDVVEGALYAYRVTLSAGAVSSASLEVRTYPPIPMLAPTGLAATGLVEGVQLSWTNHSHLATELVVIRSAGINAYPYLEVAHLPPDATSYQDLQLATGYYTYRVEARRPGETAWSSNVNAVTLPLPGGLTLAATFIQLPALADPFVRRDAQGQWFTGGGSALWDPIHLRTPNGTGWDVQTFPEAERWYAPFFLLDHQQQPHLVTLRTVVQGTNNTAVIHQWRDGSGWHEEEVARNALDYPHGFTFTLDASDALHLLLLKDGGGVASTGNLEYAHHTSAGWVTEAVGGFAPALTDVQSLSLAVDAMGVVHLAVGEPAHLWHAERSLAGTWTAEETPTGGSSETGFLDLRALGSGDLLAFYDATHTPGDASQIDLICLRRVGGAWGTPVVVATRPPDGATVALAVAPSEQRFAADVRTNEGQKLYVDDGTGWKETLVGPPVYNSAVGFDAAGKVWLLTQPDTSALAVLYAEAP